MKDVMLSFGKGLDKYLTKDQIKEQAPLVFADAPTNPDVSDKYLFVNTETIIDDLDKLGWYPVNAAQRKSTKKKGTIFSKHMVSFQNPDIMINSADGDDAYPRILLTNSHDGMQAFKFSVGIYRLVCSNGLVVADEEFSDFKIKHKGYSFAELRSVVRHLWRTFNVIQEKITQGNFHAALTGAKVRKVRKIKSFEKDMKVNKQLFKLATNLI